MQLSAGVASPLHAVSVDASGAVRVETARDIRGWWRALCKSSLPATQVKVLAASRRGNPAFHTIVVQHVAD